MNLDTSAIDFGRGALVTRTYQPIIRGYCGVAGAYYVLMTPIHVMQLSGAAMVLMTTVAVAASLFAIVSFIMLGRTTGLGRLEVVAAVMHMLVLANVLVAIDIEYSPAKLSYFILLSIIFALASVSTRQTLISVFAALSGMFYELVKNNPEELETYVFIAIAGVVCATGIAFFLRGAVGQAVLAKHKAETELAEARTISETMRSQSLSDSLTGLPNRRAFFENLREVAGAQDSQSNAWLVLLDLDGFKAVNDNYGHVVGDELLKAVAQRLQEYCDEGVHVTRMGGDEFNIVISLSGRSSDPAVAAWCQRLLQRIAEVYLIDERPIQISGSIGCYQVGSDELETDLIRKADYALLHAKRTGKNRVVVFHEEHARDASDRLRIENALRVADFMVEIDLLFQPQFDLNENRIVGAEALARWNSPEIGKIGPDHFIKIAEESGMIARITLAVLDKALATLTSWDDPLPLSINLSGNDLISDTIIDQIIDRVSASGLDPKLLEFEVTETAMMADMQRASANLKRLSDLGHPLALDDFGTGYSNFNYLRTLPIDKLKVDRSFMENLADPMTEKILHSLSGMARTLGVDCLLEGIENELELVMAKRVGAEFIQGYLFGRPMKLADLQAIRETGRVDETGHAGPSSHKRTGTA